MTLADAVALAGVVFLSIAIWELLARKLERHRARRKPALPPPPQQLCGRRSITAGCVASREQLALQLMQLDQMLRHAMTGTPWAYPDVRFRS